VDILSGEKIDGASLAMDSYQVRWMAGVES
jgi:hypothetical protein